MTAEAETARPPEEDLSVRLVALWQGVAPAMADLPIYNPRLDVRATHFIAYRGWRVGVVTTPWFMNVVALPDAPETLPSQGSNVIVSLPAGDLEAISGQLEGFGPVATVSLFSPMENFDDAGIAGDVAEAALAHLFEPPPEPEPVPEPPRASSAVDRRSLLFGRRGGERT